MTVTIVMRTGRERCIGYPSDDNGSHPFNGRLKSCVSGQPYVSDVSSSGALRGSGGAETAGPFA